eukprot:UN25171
MDSLQAEWDQYLCIHNGKKDNVKDCGCSNEILIVLSRKFNDVEETFSRVKTYLDIKGIHFLINVIREDKHGREKSNIITNTTRITYISGLTKEELYWYVTPRYIVTYKYIWFMLNDYFEFSRNTFAFDEFYENVKLFNAGITSPFTRASHVHSNAEHMVQYADFVKSLP